MTDARAHFGGYAREYRAHRPDYPAALFDLVAEASPGLERVWDCGAGSGQAAAGLARRFATVIATDLSIDQLTAWRPPPPVARAVAAAEAAPLRDRSVQAVTVAQALHWFVFDRFFGEAARVAVRGALLATWSYGLLRIAGEVDELLDRLYHEILAGWWLPQRRHVDAGYRDIPVPFEPIDVRVLEMEKRWEMSDLIAYLDTWSAVRSYRVHRGADPLDVVRVPLERAWARSSGDPREPALVTWPLTLRRFRIG